TVRDLLDGHDGEKGIPGEVIRFVFLSTHYTKPMDWTAEKARQAEATLRKWYILVSGETPSEEAPAEVIDALADDLNTSAAISEMHKLASDERFGDLMAAMRQLGLLETGMGDWTKPRAATDPVQFEIGRVQDKWFAFRQAKTFEKADAIKNDALAVGIEFYVNPDKTPGVRFKASGFTDAESLEVLRVLANKDY
ncbi:MAG: cysteine--tRNA ligase, partial [Rhodobacteraceae bacterium]|nr:cysteine--tRNA ligase [Paracoccaceae bacterium]